jgi:hypothetical protein
MKIAVHIITLFVFVTLSADSYAQVDSNRQPTNNASGVVVHADPRIDLLLKKHRNIQIGYIYSGKGYRVQIYTGTDRAKANELKVDFIRRFPGIRTYLTYVQPQFRVKVGDFKTRAEAQKLYEETNAVYGASMIVPDIVVINTAKND